jgi:hypothetical protein
MIGFVSVYSHHNFHLYNILNIYNTATFWYANVALLTEDVRMQSGLFFVQITFVPNFHWKMTAWTSKEKMNLKFILDSHTNE